MENSHVLVIHSDPAVHQLVGECLAHDRVRITVVRSAKDGLSLLDSERVHVLVTGADAFNAADELIRRAAAIQPLLGFVVIGDGSAGRPAAAQRRSRRGAAACKAGFAGVARAAVHKALERTGTRSSVRPTTGEAASAEAFLHGNVAAAGERIVAGSKAMGEILNMARRCAPTDAPVLICGEPDTGKELIAREIHRQSRRANGPFVRVACGSIREADLAETLFGRGDAGRRPGEAAVGGLLGKAQGGTLFLDNVGDLPLSAQARLLDVSATGAPPQRRRRRRRADRRPRHRLDLRRPGGRDHAADVPLAALLLSQRRVDPRPAAAASAPGRPRPGRGLLGVGQRPPRPPRRPGRVPLQRRRRAMPVGVQLAGKHFAIGQRRRPCGAACRPRGDRTGADRRGDRGPRSPRRFRHDSRPLVRKPGRDRAVHHRRGAAPLRREQGGRGPALGLHRRTLYRRLQDEIPEKEKAKDSPPLPLVVGPAILGQPGGRVPLRRIRRRRRNRDCPAARPAVSCIASQATAPVKRVIHIPVVHTLADLGSLGESVRTAMCSVMGRRAGASANGPSANSGATFAGPSRLCRSIGPARIYQDGLPVCGKEEQIVRELAAAGSVNHQLVLELVGKGASLVGTEDPELLLREYHLQRAGWNRPAARTGRAASAPRSGRSPGRPRRFHCPAHRRDAGKQRDGPAFSGRGPSARRALRVGRRCRAAISKLSCLVEARLGALAPAAHAQSRLRRGGEENSADSSAAS